MDPIVALDRSYDELRKIVAGLSADQLSAATPCGEWDVRSLLNHTLGAAWMFTLVNEGRQAGEDGGDLIGDDPVGAVERAAETNVASWRAEGALEGDRTYPFGTFPAAGGLMINVGEIAVHTWDLAHATGHEFALDPEIADLVHGFYAQTPMDMYREHGAFGAEVPVGDGVSASDRALAFFGRQP